MYLLEVPTPEEYRKNCSKDGVWTTGSETGYKVLLKYWQGKEGKKVVKTKKVKTKPTKQTIEQTSLF